jgi:TetR/AcrR family transcriptional regulator, ethionamide resistance regulator
VSDASTTSRYDAGVAVLSKRTETVDRRREAEARFLAVTEALLAAGESYADLSIERIAAAAGRPRTAFYLYFRDKRELLMRATEAVTNLLYEQADRWWSGADGRRDLRAALTDILGTYRDHAPLLGAVVEAAAYDAEIGVFWRELVGRFIEATEQRMVEEGTEPGHAAGTAFALCWMTERTCYQQVARGGSVDDPDLVEALVGVWERSVYGGE